MKTRPLWRGYASTKGAALPRKLLAAAALLALLACGGSEQTAATNDPATGEDETAAQSGDDLVETGTLTMKSWKVAFIGSAGQSKGTVSFQGEQRKFQMTGLGIGGVGVSTSSATGVVYNMESWEDFTGPYTSGRSGVTLGDNEVLKDRMLWLKNDSGVSIKLTTDKSGVELNLGADGSVIQWDE